MEEQTSCHGCGGTEFDCSDGYYYCQTCGVQAEDIIETGVADEDFVPVNGSAIYLQGNRRAKQTVLKTEPFTMLTQSQTQGSQFWRSVNEVLEEKPKKQEYDEMKPYTPQDFGGTSTDVTYSPQCFSADIRLRYTMGIQLMIQYQCQALVETFGVSPLICGVAGVIWSRLVVMSRVFAESWADMAIEESELQKEGDLVVGKPRGKYRKEPHNVHGQRAATIWLRSLRKKVPLSSSLAISFLACHIAREAILPTDIVKWALEGKLPYLNAFLNIDKTFGHPSRTCPFSSSFMFRPYQVVRPRELESHAGSIAGHLGLELPPVNFHAIARRYLKQLLLPVEKILPYACRIYEWSMPPDLWLSANLYKRPSHLCVMSIIMVVIRIMYNINGFGKWENSIPSSGVPSSSCRVKKSKSKRKVQRVAEDSDKRCKFDNSNSANMCPSSSSLDGVKSKGKGSLLTQDPEFDTTQLLLDLEGTYEKILDKSEYMKDLPAYLKYCKDVVFDGLAPSFEDHEEENIIKQLWEFYEKEEDYEPAKEGGTECFDGLDQGRANRVSMDDMKPPNGCIGSTPLNGQNSEADIHSSRFLDGDQCSQRQQTDKNPQPSDCALAEGTLKERCIERLKSNMEDNGFLYIPPRVKLRRLDYLLYARKNNGGSRCYVAHADYYILLRACARLVQVDARYMHIGMLKLERRLAWFESRIRDCLHMSPRDIPPEPCADAVKEPPFHDIHPETRADATEPLFHDMYPESLTDADADADTDALFHDIYPEPLVDADADTEPPFDDMYPEYCAEADKKPPLEMDDSLDMSDYKFVLRGSTVVS